MKVNCVVTVYRDTLFVGFLRMSSSVSFSSFFLKTKQKNPKQTNKTNKANYDIPFTLSFSHFPEHINFQFLVFGIFCNP